MHKLIILAALGGLVACQQTAPEDSFTSIIDPTINTGSGGVQVTRGVGPPNADPQSCYGREIEPAVIETVTEQLMVEPEQLDRDGNIRRPAVFVTATEQRIVEDRTETWFETPCAMEGNVEYITNLQRALSARGHYDGPATGTMNRATVRAIRAYQQPQGLDSGVLSLAAARQLGLSVWDPELSGN
ncbi:peptidoglycan-binding protein [Rhodobacteraceae bacterium N5(2021)]|uniref:Peptidoglycan-binding protein n=1 Tax=Gymnodinialimonas phycosphaerae TaxID=2841589 RepID=A0A975TYQ3_9RHOB|nr:peptidoglycan-binding domain-containing protein [Gymnodinialimonas phycosphaerae]MBY4892962.1 peptidoglycan-binding protein [Gymnodinialimonas phycosphaerae]